MPPSSLWNDVVTVPASADVRWILRLLAARRQEPGLWNDVVTVPASADVRWILRLLAARRQEPGLSYVATGPGPGVVGKHTMALSSVCTGRALFQVRGGQRNVDQNQFSDSELACFATPDLLVAIHSAISLHCDRPGSGISESLFIALIALLSQDGLKAAWGAVTGQAAALLEEAPPDGGRSELQSLLHALLVVLNACARHALQDAGLLAGSLAKLGAAGFLETQVWRISAANYFGAWSFILHCCNAEGQLQDRGLLLLGLGHALAGLPRNAEQLRLFLCNAAVKQRLQLN
eukprot:s3897_g3.t1